MRYTLTSSQASTGLVFSTRPTVGRSAAFAAERRAGGDAERIAGGTAKAAASPVIGGRGFEDSYSWR